MSPSASTDARATRHYDHLVIGGGSAGCVVAEDRDAVVDPQLRLRGLDRLRLADASMFPLQVGVNPNLTIAMQAGRCAAWLPGG
ncbi:MAG: GMC oxidoreductase [Anaerolineaceae bacterium]|nr:GMC oxidoreductase [Anaerolineaceae bacterium]